MAEKEELVVKKRMKVTETEARPLHLHQGWIAPSSRIAGEQERKIADEIRVHVAQGQAQKKCKVTTASLRSRSW